MSRKIDCVFGLFLFFLFTIKSNGIFINDMRNISWKLFFFQLIVQRCVYIVRLNIVFWSSNRHTIHTHFQPDSKLFLHNNDAAPPSSSSLPINTLFFVRVANICSLHAILVYDVCGGMHAFYLALSRVFISQNLFSFFLF